MVDGFAFQAWLST